MSFVKKSVTITSTLIIIFGIILVISIFNGGYFIVHPGEVAIKIRLGKLVDSYDEGVYLKIPFIDKVKKFSIRIRRSDIKTEAFSKDLQTIDIDVVVNHRIEKNNVKSIYRNLGANYEETIIEPIVQEEIKAVIAKFSAEDLIAHRADVAAEISKVVKSRLKEKQIVITDISITNFDFTEEFLKAVEEKQIAEQKARKAQKDVERVKMEAEQEIIKARAEAEALKLQKQAVSDKLIKLRQTEAMFKAIEKWDGKLPYYNGGAIPFINIPNQTEVK